MKYTLLALAIGGLPGLAGACSLPADFADAYKNDITFEVLRDYRVDGTVDKVRDLAILDLEVVPYQKFSGKIACYDSVRMSGLVTMNLTRKVSHNLEKRRQLNEAFNAGEISEAEYEARLNGEETCAVRAEVKAVKEGKKAGEVAYRFDSKIGVEIRCD